jgi:hypothetical protein
VSAPGAGQAAHRTAGQDPAARLATLRHLAGHQVMGLTSVFLLGMAVSLIGLPSETTGAAHVASIAFLAAHALIALGLAVGAVLLLWAAARLGRPRRLAIADAAAIALAVAAGILALITKIGWWSFAMAAGFIAALLASGSLLRPETTRAGMRRASLMPSMLGNTVANACRAAHALGDSVRKFSRKSGRIM